jgi:hypothetical protein
MTIYFSPSSYGFFDTDLFFIDDIPNDKIEVSLNDYNLFLQEQSVGKKLTVDSNGVISAIVEELTQEQKLNQLIIAVQNHLDSAAQAEGYDNIFTASLRASFVGPYQAEGLIFAQWMDSCWETCYTIKAEVENATRAIPTESELIALLPVLNLAQ